MENHAEFFFFITFAELRILNLKIMRMIKNILHLFFAAALLVGAPTLAHAESPMEMQDAGFQEVTLNYAHGSLHVKNANGMMLYVYNLAGKAVCVLKIDGNDKRVDLALPMGLYIVKVGSNFSRKITISR